MYIKDTKSSYNRRTLIELFLTDRPATYDDKECRIENCRKGAFRSVTELLQIVQSYFPNTTLEDVLRIISKIIADSSKPIALIWCTQVKKVVLKYDVNALPKGEFTTKYSASNYQNTKGVDGYSINDYLKIIKTLN